MKQNQRDIFVSYEADNWFHRNRIALEQFDPSRDFPLRLLELYQLKPKSAIEIGAANGVRLASLSQKAGTRVVAVEPSSEAIRIGTSMFPEVQFVKGTSDSIPVTEQFELVIVNFVLHWVDRHYLLRSIAEIDRLVTDNGFLIIGDFIPSSPVKVRYHHLPEEQLFTYKQDYVATFLASGIYQLLGFLTFDHSHKSMKDQINSADRCGTWLLSKSVSELYQEVTLPG